MPILTGLETADGREETDLRGCSSTQQPTLYAPEWEGRYGWRRRPGGSV